MISDYLKKIKEAIYGEEVRGSIHDAIEQCYKDATGHPESVAATVKEIGEVSKRIDNLIATGTAQSQEVGKTIATTSQGSKTKINFSDSNVIYTSAFDTVKISDSLFARIDEDDGSPLQILKEGLYYLNASVEIKSEESTIPATAYMILLEMTDEQYNKIGSPIRRVIDFPSNPTFKIERQQISYLFKAEKTTNLRFIVSSIADTSDKLAFSIDDIMLTALDWKGKQSADLSELHDLRIGADGVVHNTAGEAVRKQIGNLTEDLINLSKDVEQILGNKIGFAYTIDFSASKLIVSYKYTNDTDCQVVFAIGGGNNLMDIRGVYMYENPNAPIVNELSSDNIWIYMNGDNFAPFQIRANSNIDGDNKEKDGSYKIFFTGGNHQYNNTGTGSTSTAHCQNIKFFIDNYEVKHDKKGYANKLKLTWENLVQGYNTTKADGTGRAILKERHSVIFDGISFYCHTELIPLEDITCDRWYGYQLIHSDKYNKCQYVDGTNREMYDRNANTKCGDKKAKKLRIFNDSTEDCADVELSDFDIGNRDLFNGDNGIFNTDYGKAYFNVINDSKVLNKNNVYTLDATYTFHKWFV